MRSRAAGGSFASAGNARNMRQLTILRHVIIGSSASRHEPACPLTKLQAVRDCPVLACICFVVAGRTICSAGQPRVLSDMMPRQPAGRGERAFAM